MLTIVCVLKSGGDYDWEYVERLYKGVQNNLSYCHDFIVLTDTFFETEKPRIRQIPLTLNLPGYWSKIELFKLKGSIIYFDLDTIILGSINRLAKEVLRFESTEQPMFYMLKAFSSRKWASGIIAWCGDFSWVYSNFTKEDYQKEKWEVDYILKELGIKPYKIKSIQDYVRGKIYSYKHHCKEGVPDDAGIICFHGKPRPREVGWLDGVCVAK